MQEEDSVDSSGNLDLVNLVRIGVYYYLSH